MRKTRGQALTVLLFDFTFLDRAVRFDFLVCWLFESQKKTCCQQPLRLTLTLPGALPMKGCNAFESLPFLPLTAWATLC